MSKKCGNSGCVKWAFQDGLCRKCFTAAQPETASAPALAWGQDPTAAWEVLSVKQQWEQLPLSDFSSERPQAPGTVRFVAISDTHCHHFCERNGHTHSAPWIPAGDVLLHAGDFTGTGLEKEVQDFNDWLALQPHTHKVVIAGNHDLTFDSESYPQLWKRFSHPKELEAQRIKSILSNCHYLQDESINLHGIKIYGSPWQPEFCGWAFNLPRGQPLLQRWQHIPTGVDILMTHGPPVGHGDQCEGGHRAGCVDLLEEIQSRVRPKYHVFGHVHEGYGVTTDGQTTFMNASTCTFHYKPFNPPLVFDVPIGTEP